MPSIDVVVVSYNSRTSLRGCVDSLCGEPDVAVTVVDNASPDDSLAAVADLPVKRVQLPTNGGFGHGCNVGWRDGDGEHVLFLNPDARIEPASLRRLSQTLDESERVGIVGPRITSDEHVLDYSIRRFPRLASTYAQALFLHRLWPDAAWSDETVRRASAYDVAADVEWLSGACLLVRRELLEALNGFDEDFFMYCEDKDLCRRAQAAGWRVRFQPEAHAVHVGGMSAPRSDLLPVLAASRIRYVRRHNGRATAFAAQAGIALGTLTHAVLGRGDARRGQARAFLRSVKMT